MKTLTHVETIKQQNFQVKEAVLQLLNCHSNHYNNLQYEVGLSYLEDEMELDELAVKEMAEMPLFWSWWRNQWIKRDITFLQTVNKMGAMRARTIYRQSKIAQTYQQYHTVNSILFAPHRATIRESYARFIGKINKQVVNG